MGNNRMINTRLPSAPKLQLVFTIQAIDDAQNPTVRAAIDDFLGNVDV